MTWETVAYSVSIFLVGFGVFLWGYREGIHYCVRQLEPFQELLKQLRDSRRK